MTRGNERLQSAVSIISCVSERTEWGYPQQLFGLRNCGGLQTGTVEAGTHLGSHKEISDVLY